MCPSLAIVAIEKIKTGTITDYVYDPQEAWLVKASF
jgi:hypothetical protein